MPLAGDAFQLVKNEKDKESCSKSRREEPPGTIESKAAKVVDPFAALGETKKEFRM